MRASYLPFAVITLCLAMLLGCNKLPTSEDGNLVSENYTAIDYKHIIPLPVVIKQSSGYFRLDKTEQINIDDKIDNSLDLVSILKRALSAGLIKDIPTKVISLDVGTTLNSNVQQIVLSVDKNLEGGKEAYQLSVSENLLFVIGGSEAGIFRGIQTLKQLLPPTKGNSPLAFQTGLIKDFPRYQHRGFMLDVARHFYTVEEVKKVIDYLAAYKYNVFHFHLTDDQGWRINIPSWPKLTAIGSTAEVNQSNCENCFYSLDEYQEIVQYADDRFITLIPEIDVPGHVKAALASYPEELYCDGDKPNWPYTGIEVRISSLCFSNPKIYAFFEDVVSEIAKRTTGKYIHIGGDETPKWVAHKDYADFMLKASAIVTKNGKTLMGWTNDLGSVEGLSSDVVGQHWTTEKHCCESTLNMAKNGSKIVMSPANKAYLDLKYDKDAPIGLHWAGYNSIENAYNWDPDTNIEQLNNDSIIGIEAALWGETITTMSDAQYMIFPRLLSLAEVAWSPQNKRSWQDFTLRVEKQLKFLEQEGINYRPMNEVVR